jgi:hypothetical protein
MAESILARYAPAGPPAELKNRIFQTKQKTPFPNWLAIAASFLFIAAIAFVLQKHVKQNKTPSPQITIAEIQHQLNRAGQSAQLLALADILAKQPTAKTRAKEIYHEVANSYPDLEAGIKAKSRLISY